MELNQLLLPTRLDISVTNQATADRHHTELFCRTVRSRSDENERAMLLLSRAGLHGQCMGVLRQEVDSIIRAIYLLQASDSRRRELLDASAHGAMWKRENGKGRLTDAEMVKLAGSLHGWTKSVYQFGCSFIHLSRYHDYPDTDPLSIISDADRTSILDHMRSYHRGPSSDRPTFDELASYFPRVLQKIQRNLECYLVDLEKLVGLGSH